MNFQQLRFVTEAVRQNFNLTEVGKSLFASQSGVSKSLKEFEDELGVELFMRTGKRLICLTPAGEALVGIIDRILVDRHNLWRVAAQFSNNKKGTLVIAATHTQARYTIPDVLKQFMLDFPDVRLMIHQGGPREIAELLVAGEADIGIATEYLDQVPDLETFPWYEWQHGVVVPKDHPLVTRPCVRLEDLAEFSLITYHPGYTGRSHLDEAFQKAGLEPDIVMVGMDTDVIMTFVRLGFGIGLIASMAFDQKHDNDFRLIPVGHLFGNNVTRIAIRRCRYLRDFAYTMLERLAPHLTKDYVMKQMKSGGKGST